jgi:hypothetical protein
MENTMDQGYFTDIISPNFLITIEQVDYDPAKFPLDPRDEATIEALAPGATYVVQHAEEDDDARQDATTADETTALESEARS